MIKNPEISALVPTLLMGLTDPNDCTKLSLDILLQVRMWTCASCLSKKKNYIMHLFLFIFQLEMCIHLLQTTFVNSIDAPSLALLVPIVHRGLIERSADTKKKLLR